MSGKSTDTRKRAVDFAEKQAVREGVCKELGIAMYRQYGEQQAAHFLGKDVSTLKRWRREKKHASFVRQGQADDDRAPIRYLGIHIADLASGVAWQNIPPDPSDLAPTG